MRFGVFEFDTDTRRLRRAGEDIHLPPKAFDLLALLLGAAPRVVTKRDLHARLWPGGVVADATLVALVKQLRRALGDRDRRAPLIRTVHRIGYALEQAGARSDPEETAARQCWLMAGARRLPLVPGENLVGRAPTAQVRLDDPGVSRIHARIELGAGGTLLLDAGSKNGTYCNGKRLDSKPVVLQDGNQLTFGTVEVSYCEPGGAGVTQTQFVPS